MRISANNKLSFQRRLKPKEEAEYSDVLRRAKVKAGNSGHSMLIVPLDSLPEHNTEFFDFAKKYWGINYIQTLPNGRYAEFKKGELKPYSGTSMDLGMQILNLSEEELRKEYAKKNKALFTEYKSLNKSRLEPKSLYQALAKEYNSFNFKNWNELDRNLYNRDIVSEQQFKSRVNELLNKYSKECDFFQFKQFLLENKLHELKKELNRKGIKLAGDMIVGFSGDEVWANPDAFLKNVSAGWGLPALNLDSVAGKELLKSKAEYYGKLYDGIRVDAAWTYIVQPQFDCCTKAKIQNKVYGAQTLDLIEEGVKKAKGGDFNKSDIMYEIIYNSKKVPELNGIYENSLIKDKMKIFTSYNMDENWGNSDAYKTCKNYILGCTNHDDYPLWVEYDNVPKRLKQIKILSKLLKIPQKDISSYSGYVQAKFAEPMRAKNNMFFFSEALNIKGRYKGNLDAKDDYKLKIPNDYETHYFNSLEKSEGYNPMGALEKAFVSKELDKTEPELYKKIVKYKKILQAPESKKRLPIALWIACSAALLLAVAMIIKGRGSAAAPEPPSSGVQI